MFNCVMEEMGIIQKDNVDINIFNEMVSGKANLDADATEKLKNLTQDCAKIINTDRCARGSEIFQCLKSAATSLGVKCENS